MIFFSPKTCGFYDSAIHGAPTIAIVDPKFKWPTIDQPDPHWVAPDDDPDAVAPTIQIPDPAVIPPMIEIPNPDCQIPADSVEITPDHHTELMAVQSKGKVIAAGEDGMPQAIDPPPPSADQLWDSYKLKAQAALADSDTTVLRCYEAGVPFPAAWGVYRKALRAIVTAATGDPSKALPVRPAYPDGT